MKIISKYWNLVRLDSSGKLRITEIERAKKLIQQQFSNLIEAEEISNTRVQKDLIALKNSPSEYLKIWSARCLRCFISHQIKQNRRDRLKNRQGKSSKCKTPSTEQLEQIATLLTSSLNSILSPEQVLFELGIAQK